MKKFVYIIALLFCACTSKPDREGDALARVEDKYLYASDIQGVLPSNIPEKDSIEMVNEYIDNWVRQQLVIAQAEKNLSKEEKDFSKQLEDYKNSLIIFQYESKLIKQKLDTLVSDEEIFQYYEKNKANFELKENIVKVVYIKIPKNTPAALPRQLIRSDKPQDLKKLQDFCHKYAVNYYLDDQNWLLFNDILKEIPIKTYNQEEYLKNNRIIEIQDSVFTYLMNIKGFMIKESLSPLSFERNNIRDIIINRRKLALIENMRNDVYENAVKKGNIEIFKK
ncbi:MAG TPA: hypothetical protein PKI01_01470 [Bacteroidales bacterium]|mgnify:CR=1 FL=1|nr:hypothetical protein [Bacteroidales bacterium]